MGAITTGVAATAAVAIAVGSAAAGYAGGAPAVERVSVGSGEQQGNRDTMDAQVSADGRYVAFTSKASNLVPGDTNGKPDVFVRDRAEGTTVLASVRPRGDQLHVATQLAAISADGRYTLFTAERRFYQLRGLLFDRQSGRTRWVTPVVGGGARGGGAVDLSADGSLVLYRHEYDMYVRDVEAGTTVHIGDSPFGAFEGDMSGDGRHVAAPFNNPQYQNVYVRDLPSTQLRLVSVAWAGDGRGNGISAAPSVSRHGGVIAFQSSATNLVRGDTNDATDIFVRDRAADRTYRVSLGLGGAQADGASRSPSISANGRFVAFTSAATNLVPGDDNGRADVFLYDRTNDTTTLVSTRSSVPVNGSSLLPHIAPGGTYIAFLSRARNLVPGDTNGAADAFVWQDLTTK